MKDPDLFLYARAIHIVGVVLWIGGVAFVTTVLIPALKNISDSQARFNLFEELEGKFALQARIVTVFTGLSGMYMLEYLNAWNRYQQVQFWWMHLMTIIWLIFSLVLFVLEPWILHKWFRKKAEQDSDLAFKVLHKMHKTLLTLSLIAVFGAVLGSHGYTY